MQLNINVPSANNSCVKARVTANFLHVVEDSLSQLIEPYLFEQNDALTQQNVSYTVENYLRTLNNTRAIQGYQVICNSSNNTGMSNELNVDIWIQPTMWLPIDEWQYYNHKTFV
jgi:phage tail sheath protein FI